MTGLWTLDEDWEEDSHPWSAESDDDDSPLPIEDVWEEDDDLDELGV
jgi:hypothetical protein